MGIEAVAMIGACALLAGCALNGAGEQKARYGTSPETGPAMSSSDEHEWICEAFEVIEVPETRIPQLAQIYEHNAVWYALCGEAGE